MDFVDDIVVRLFEGIVFVSETCSDARFTITADLDGTCLCIVEGGDCFC
jgi:hypothetical protein